MGYHTLFSDHNLALLSDWLAETGELYVDIQLPHSGGSGTAYFIRSLQELKELTRRQTWPEISITIFHRMQYPLRGVANEQLLNEALEQITDGEWYSIVSLDDYFPAPCVFFGSGQTHEELRRDLTDVIGQSVGIGQNPFDYHDDRWFHSRPNEVFQLTVSKNQNYHEDFAKNPERYRSIIDLWSE